MEKNNYYFICLNALMGLIMAGTVNVEKDESSII